MTQNTKKYVIAIDGPSATGKGVLAKNVASKLGITYIDTGAMYRAVGLYFYEKGLELNETNIKNNIDNINIDIYYENSEMKILLNNRDVSEQIRTNVISMMASDVSKFTIVREKLVEMQRKMGSSKSVVLEGRDIGTVVFPNADIKFYLTASVEERARRRQRDLEKKGEIIDIETVKSELETRDYNDMNREVSPLKKADDAILVDTTSLSIQDTVDKVISLIEERVKGI